MYLTTQTGYPGDDGGCEEMGGTEQLPADSFNATLYINQNRQEVVQQTLLVALFVRW